MATTSPYVKNPDTRTSPYTSSAVLIAWYQAGFHVQDMAERETLHGITLPSVDSFSY
jgi:hypothetical protein